MTPELIQALGEVLSSPWWAAVALGIGMVVHFTWITVRDRSIENRFSDILDKLLEMSEKRSEAEMEQAKAIVALQETQAFVLQAILDRNIQEAPVKDGGD